MENIVQQVHRLIKQNNTNNPFELCDILNIKIVTRILPQHINGFYMDILEIPHIFIDSSLSKNERIITCAHELGHYILHPGLNTLFMREKTLMNNSKFEVEANRFAAYLLIEDENLLELLQEGYTHEQIAMILRLPEEYIINKIMTLN